MHGGFASMSRVVDIPMIARRSTRGRAETRRAAGVPDDRPFVLASFSGYGLDVPFDQIVDNSFVQKAASTVKGQ